jgi:hypothetical protein
MASGATDLINEAATAKITGEEERYSGTDLPVFQANVQASIEVVTLLQPYGSPCSTSVSVSRRASRPRWPGCPRCRTRTSTRTTPAGTCASRPAPTTRWSPSTPCGTWPGSAWGSCSTTGWNSASAGPARLQGRHPQYQVTAGRSAERPPGLQPGQHWGLPALRLTGA